MKTFSGGGNKTLDRAAIKVCVGINLLATPGLGTIMAGRYLVGAMQLLLACAGFLLFLCWIWLLLRSAMAGQTDVGQNWLWQWALVSFGLSWLWALWSSVVMLRNRAEAGKIPPKLNG
jgi:hypothetical protein